MGDGVPDPLASGWGEGDGVPDLLAVRVGGPVLGIRVRG